MACKLLFMAQPYQFYHRLIVRTPLWPFPEVIDEATIWRSLEDTRFREALYLASPVLLLECDKWQAGELTEPRRVEKLLGTLTRYYLRATSRCTPFGLFAGCAIANWGPASQMQLAPELTTRHTRLDMHYLCALAQQLTVHPAIRPHLRYWPNSSLYAIGEKIRYVEYHYTEGQRVNQLSEVRTLPYVQRALAAAQAGITYAELITQLTEEHTEAEAVTQFIAELVEVQILVPELEPSVTGPEFLGRLQAVLARLPTSVSQTIARTLAEVQRQLQAFDQQATPNPPAHYESLFTLLAPLGVPFEPGKLFQTDAILAPGASAFTLDATYQAELLAAIDALTYLGSPPSISRLTDFRHRFLARYDDREVPLLEALDNESGLSYTEYGQQSYSPLIHDLTLVPATGSVGAPPRTPAQQFLYQKLRQAEHTGQYAITLTQAELRGFVSAPEPLAPSVAAVFRVLDSEHLLLESAGGSSAVNLLGRFAHAEPAIAQLIRELTAREQAHNPGVAFAEICHLPASRVGNLLQRPSFRALEIPYLAQASLPVEGQVPVQDLLLSVRGTELVLRSRRTGQRIIPRLSTAHNFAHEALPVYQFLCDLQTQGLQPHLGFDWRAVCPHTKFLPRLTYQRVVLTPASWHFEAADWQPLLAAAPIEFMARLTAFRQQWQLSQRFVLVDGDNELLIDTDNELLVRVWLDTIRQRPHIELREYLLEPTASPVRDAAGRPFVQQFIALLVRQEACYPVANAALPSPTVKPASVEREFALGSEWLYYKLYCGQKVADTVLLDVIGPLTRDLRVRGLLDNWFFIRYADPGNHLRLRLHLPDPARIGEVISLMHNYLAPARANGSVWNVQVDTYRRELTRYGTRTIAASESLSGYQSEALLTQLAAQVDNPAFESWLWSITVIEELLLAFSYPLERKVAMFKRLKEAFAQEFRVDKTLRRQLDSKYRQVRSAVEQALAQAATGPPPAALCAIVAGIKQVERQGLLEIELEQLLASYLHMLLNRLIPAEARLHELVLYDFLFRAYQSQLARSPS